MFYIDPYREKPLKIFLSETRKPSLWYLVHSFVWWTSTNIVALGSKLAPPKGHVIHRALEGKPLKILFETRRPMPFILGTQYCLVDLCQDCSSYSPGARNGPAKGPTCLTWTYRENLVWNKKAQPFDIWYTALSSGPLPTLNNWAQAFKRHKRGWFFITCLLCNFYFKRLLLWHCWTDFSIISQECFLGVPLPNCSNHPALLNKMAARAKHKRKNLRHHETFCQAPAPNSPRPVILYKPTCFYLCQTLSHSSQGLYNTVLKPPACHLKTFIFKFKHT